MKKLFDFSELNMAQQMALSIMIPVSPFILGQFLFFGLALFAGYDLLTCLFISSMFTMGGFVLYLFYRDQTRKAVMGMEPFNAIFRWSKSYPTWENQMVLHRTEIRADQIVTPVKYDDQNRPIFENPIKVKVLEKAFDAIRRREVLKWVERTLVPKELRLGLFDMALMPDIAGRIIAGKNATEIIMPRRSIAPNGVPYRRTQFLHFYPHQDDFHQCTDQFVMHDAQLINCSSSVIDCTFLYWGERDEPIPVFLITSSPQLTELIQQSIGIKPLLMENDPDGNEERVGNILRKDIQSAMILGDTNIAMTYAQLLQARNRQIEGLTEDRRDGVDVGISLHGAWSDDMAEVHRIKGFDWKAKWWIFILIGLGIIALAGLAYLLFFMPTTGVAK